MTRSHLLPCSCGQKVAVQPRQAGEVINCSCGASLQVPTMLEMAALERAQPGPQRPVRPWGIRESLALLGAVLFVGALGLVIFLLLHQPPPPIPARAEMDPDTIRRQTRALTPLESRRVWQFLRAAGPDGRMSPEEHFYADILGRYRELLLRWWLSMGVAIAIAVAGLGLIVIPLLKR